MSDDEGNTPLHIACELGDLARVKQCNTGNIETRNKYNYRPIHVACIWGHLGIVEYLHQHGWDIEAPGNSGNRPLHLASEHGRLDVVKYLCKQQCQLDAPNCNLWRPIHLACKFGHTEIVRHLCEQGCDKEVCTDRGERPLHLACIHGHMEIVRFLCEQNCDIEVSTSDNYKTIQLACKHGHIAIVDYLCQQKCNIEVQRRTTDPTYFGPQWSHIEAFITKLHSEHDSDIHKSCHDIRKFLLEESPKLELIEKIRYMREHDESYDQSSWFQGIYSTKFRIGEGAYGKVYKVNDPELDYTFCMKSLKPKTNAPNQKAKHIEFNINKYINDLHHERIVQYFGMINVDAKMLIFMEYVEGKSLDKHMDKNPLPHNKVIQYSKEILEGLKYLHRNKIIHRDIKPANIMINTKDHVKLCDFGLSCYLESIGQKSEIHTADSSSKMTSCGTHNYMAPELVTGQKYSYPVDIWALGASVVEMLTGVWPFHGMVEYAMILHIGTIQEIEFVPSQPMSEGMSEYCAIIFHMESKQNVKKKIQLVPNKPMPEDMKSLVAQMLCLSPSTRATADKLLELIHELPAVTDPVHERRLN